METAAGLETRSPVALAWFAVLLLRGLALALLLSPAVLTAAWVLR